jgi:hypothetical protein
MNLYFQIVRRAYGRFAWELVDTQGGLVARSDHDWGSRKKVRRTINRIKMMVDNAAVVDTTKSSYPKMSFTLTPYVFPLFVGEPADHLSVARVGGKRQGKSSKQGQDSTYGPFPMASQGTGSKSMAASKAAQSAYATSVGGAANTQQASHRQRGTEKATQSAAKKVTQNDSAKRSTSSGTKQTSTRRPSRAKKAAAGGTANPASAKRGRALADRTP